MITFEGYWNKELQEGCGIETWKDGSMYKGEYSDGKKTGVGTYSWSDGTWYEGICGKIILLMDMVYFIF